MATFINIWLLLLAGHFLCDYALQNDYMVKAKSRHTPEGSNHIWLIVLTAHSLIHSIPVGILSVVLLGFESLMAAVLIIGQAAIHFTIDKAKTDGDLTYIEDQVWHVVIVTILSILLWVVYK